MEELIRLLEAERERLGWVCYRTVVAVLLLRNEEARFLGRATDEIHDAVDLLEQVDQQRADATRRVAATLHLAASPVTLEQIIQAVPWSTAQRLQALQEHLRTLQADLHELTNVGTAVTAAKLDVIRRSLGRWGNGAERGYGVGAPPPSGPSRFDAAL